LTGAVIGTGKGGNWRRKPPDAEFAIGAATPTVWANARTCPVHAVLGRANLGKRRFLQILIISTAILRESLSNFCKDLLGFGFVNTTAKIYCFGTIIKCDKTTT